MRWKQLLQLPVRMVFVQLLTPTPNSSQMASFSTISHSLDLSPSLRTIQLTGFLELQTSQTFTERQSLATMYLPFEVKVAEDILEIKPSRQFFWLLAVPTLQQVVFSSLLAATRMSATLTDPLFMPYRKILSVCGCILQQVIVSLSSPLLEAIPKSHRTQGCSGRSRSQRKVWDWSVESRNCSFPDGHTCLMGWWCLAGKAFCSSAAQLASIFYSLGMVSSFPAERTIFLSNFSQIFQSLMLRVLVVTSFRYFPWGFSHAMSAISSSTSTLRRGSNSLKCDWNSVKYSSFCGVLSLAFSLWKMMTLPALSPSAMYLPVLSNLRELMMSSSCTGSLGPLYPNIWENLQAVVVLLLFLSIQIFYLKSIVIHTFISSQVVPVNAPPPHLQIGLHCSISQEDGIQLSLF